MNDAEQRILKKIIDDAELKAEEIISDAQKVAEGIIAEAKSKVAAKAESDRAIFTAEGSAVMARMAAQSDMDCRKTLLSEKIDIISEVYEVALQELSEMPRDKYIQLLVKMISKYEINDGDSVILSRKDRDSLGCDFIAAVNSKGIKLILSDRTAPISGGFILSKGDIEYNCSFDAIVRTNKNDIDETIAGILFSEENNA